MDLKNGSVALFVKNINTSKEFYHDLLGLPINLDFGKNVIFKAGFTLWEIQPGHIIPSTIGTEQISNPSNRFELYFEAENLPGISETLKTKGVKFLHQIHQEPWGQNTIRFFDPDNHLVEVGEPMRLFVCRFYDQGMTPEQVSARTSVPVEEVKRLINQPK